MHLMNSSAVSKKRLFDTMQNVWDSIHLDSFPGKVPGLFQVREASLSQQYVVTDYLDKVDSMMTKDSDEERSSGAKRLSWFFKILPHVTQGVCLGFSIWHSSFKYLYIHGW